MARTLIGEQREGNASVYLSAGVLGYRKTVTYRVETDDPDTVRDDILYETVGVPIVGLYYNPQRATCTALNANRFASNLKVWEVVAEFDSLVEGQFPVDNGVLDPGDEGYLDPQAPYNWYPDINKIESFENEEYVLTKDLSDPPKPCVNSAGDQFETPITTTSNLASFQFTQYEIESSYWEQTEGASSVLNFLVLTRRNESVNTDEFLDFDVRTLKVNVLEAIQGTFGGFDCWCVKYKITYNPRGWKYKVLDYGSSYLVPLGEGESGPQLKLPYLDSEGLYKTYGPLDGSGGKTTAADVAELQFQTRVEVPFGATHNGFIRTRP